MQVLTSPLGREPVVEPPSSSAAAALPISPSPCQTQLREEAALCGGHPVRICLSELVVPAEQMQ